MNGTDFSPEVLQQLLCLIGRTPSLEELWLDHCGLEHAHIEILVAGLPNTQIKYLSICDNSHLGDEDVALILSGRGQPQLSGLSFLGCAVTEQVMVLINQHLKIDRTLRYIKGLPKCEDRNIFDRIMAALKRNRSIKITDQQATHAVHTFLVGQNPYFQGIHHVMTEMLKKDSDGWLAIQQLSATSRAAWDMGVLVQQDVQPVPLDDEVRADEAPQSGSLTNADAEDLDTMDFETTSSVSLQDDRDSAPASERKRARQSQEGGAAQGGEGGSDDADEPSRKKPRHS